MQQHRLHHRFCVLLKGWFGGGLGGGLVFYVFHVKLKRVFVVVWARFFELFFICLGFWFWRV